MIASPKPCPQSKHVSFIEEISDTDGTHTVNPLSSDSPHVLDSPTDYSSPLPSSSSSSPLSCTSSTSMAPTASDEQTVSAYDNISAVVMTADLLASHLEFPVSLHGLYKHLDTSAMIDSGATGIFINESMVNEHQLHRRLLKDPIRISNIDGTANRAGLLTHFVRMNITVGAHTSSIDMLVTNLGPKPLILGLPWLEKVNPLINWKSREMEIPSDPDQFPTLRQLPTNRKQRRHFLRASLIEDSTDQVWCLASHTYSTKLTAEANQAKEQLTFEQMVPKEYHRHAKVFSEEESHRLPKPQPWDHTIDLKSDAPESLRSKVYPMPPNEQEELDRFIKENVEKGYIVPSKSPMSSPVFFIKKKDGKLRLIQDYRKLNEITIKNTYPLPLASDIINKLKGAKVFTKFDV